MGKRVAAGNRRCVGRRWYLGGLGRARLRAFVVLGLLAETRATRKRQERGSNGEDFETIHGRSLVYSMQPASRSEAEGVSWCGVVNGVSGTRGPPPTRPTPIQSPL